MTFRHPYLPARENNWHGILRRRQRLRGRSMNSKSAGYPRFRLFTPNPPDYFFLGCSLTEKKPADPLASMLAD